MVKKSIMFKQCTLERGNVVVVSWLPVKFAQKGRYLRLKDGGKWTNGWLVTEVGSHEVSSEAAREASRNYKHQREASDI